MSNKPDAHKMICAVLKQMNADVVVAFKAARRRLSSSRFRCRGKKEYICHALELAEERRVISRVQCQTAKRVILKRLGKHDDLADWVSAISPKHRRQVHADRVEDDGRKMQRTRNAWLESLVKEFSA